MNFKNGFPGVYSIFFNTVTTHQSFVLLVKQMRKELVTKKCNHAQQHYNFRVLHFLQKFVHSPCGFVLNLSLVIV